MNQSSKRTVRFAAWSALLGAVFAYLNVTFSLMVTGQDTGMILHGATMLGLPRETRDLFRTAMLCDILGFYFPFLIIAGFLWRVFREKAGALGDVAMLAIVVYVLVGIAGAAMLQAVLNPLAHLHAGGDDSVKSAAEAAWTSIAYAVQDGLWWLEGPVLLFWGLVISKLLKQTGWGWFSPLVLKVVAFGFGLFFLAGFFPQLGEISELLETLVVLLLPVWMLLFGWQLLRRQDVLLSI
jgi:hypothetical protein